MRDLFINMDKSGTAIPPIIMLQVLHMAYPQFAEKGEHGGYTQQVIHQCFIEHLFSYKNILFVVTVPKSEYSNKHRKNL